MSYRVKNFVCERWEKKSPETVLYITSYGQTEIKHGLRRIFFPTLTHKFAIQMPKSIVTTLYWEQRQSNSGNRIRNNGNQIGHLELRIAYSDCKIRNKGHRRRDSELRNLNDTASPAEVACSASSCRVRKLLLGAWR